MSAVLTLPDDEYLSRLDAALRKCTTMSQFRSVFARAEVGAKVDDKRTSTAVCVEIHKIVRRERERIEMGDHA